MVYEIFFAFLPCLTIVTCSICVAMGVYYYVVVLPHVLRMHNNAKHVPAWFNQSRHWSQFLIRHRATTHALQSSEGVVSWVAMGMFRVLLNWIYGYHTLSYYTTWDRLEDAIRTRMLSIDIDAYDVVLGVDYGGAIIAEYLHATYGVRHIGYLRPRKKRSVGCLFLTQLVLTYIDAFFFLFGSRVTKWFPYFTEMESVDIPFDTCGKKILIVDDGVLSGGTVQCCLNFMNNFYSCKACDMMVLHGLPRQFNKAEKGNDFECTWINAHTNRVYISKHHLLCYLPWGQT